MRSCSSTLSNYKEPCRLGTNFNSEPVSSIRAQLTIGSSCEKLRICLRLDASDVHA